MRSAQKGKLSVSYVWIYRKRAKLIKEQENVEDILMINKRKKVFGGGNKMRKTHKNIDKESNGMETKKLNNQSR